MVHRTLNSRTREKRESKNMEKLVDEKLTEILSQLQTPRHYFGYKYLKDTVNIILHDISAQYHLCSIIYPKVAEMNNTTPAKAETAIRHLKDKILKLNNIDNINKVLGTHYTQRKKFTNSELIAVISDVVRLQI